MKKCLRLWLLLAGYSLQMAFHSRLSAGLFLIGKVIRFVMLLLLLFLLFSRTKAIAGYSFWQMVLFFCTFNLIDVLAQFFLREVYRFRSYIVTGSFDYILTKPFSPLFRVLFGGSDMLDLVTLFPLLFFIGYVTGRLPGVNLVGVLLYILLVINGFFIAVAFHIVVVSFGILTTEVDNAIWVFRDLTQLGRIPVDVYREPVSFLNHLQLSKQ